MDPRGYFRALQVAGVLRLLRGLPGASNLQNKVEERGKCLWTLRGPRMMLKMAQGWPVPLLTRKEERRTKTKKKRGETGKIEGAQVVCSMERLSGLDLLVTRRVWVVSDPSRSVGTTRLSRGKEEIAYKSGKCTGNPDSMQRCFGLLEASNVEINHGNGLERSNMYGVCRLFGARASRVGSRWKTVGFSAMLASFCGCTDG
ncbi:hypothetical protein CRG98_018967 [Punica granatum]|uniref:Uncharacterized protein n=1 Tax=Punica granatum TaxID=22663 RepID=A0A2I0JWC6_PUNGR|nr:hypothetical protein CRG98_018967 [Punica granatum]